MRATVERYGRQVEYVDGVEQAKMIRQILRREFPTVKFSVRLSRYSGGSSIDISWTDGPATKRVEHFTDPFRGGGFDGMIDMAYDVQSYVTPDGQAHNGPTTGTEGSLGVYPAANPTPPADARLVQFSADHVFCSRRISSAPERFTAAEQFLREHLSGMTDWEYTDKARRIVFEQDFLNGETLNHVYRRVILQEEV